MSRESLPVIAAIPNYNMADSLSTLLPQVLEQEYDDVYVLDDASTDHTREAATPFGSDIHFIAGRENVGAGANRNRIVAALGRDAIIHFIDADMRLASDRTPEVARELLDDPRLAFVGGLVETMQGQQHFWNYGPRMCLHTSLSAGVQGSLELLNNKNPKLAESLRLRLATYLEEWPNPFKPPAARKTFWAVESNLIIKSAIYKQMSGYDPSLRDHEIQDLAIRLDRAGLQRKFSPLFAAVHTEQKVREGNRQAKMHSAELQIIRKYGWKDWLLPNGHFKPNQ